MMFINLLGLMLIALIVWWFWLYKPNKTIVQGNEVLIEVRDGVYNHPQFRCLLANLSL